MIWLTPKTSELEISAIPKYNTNWLKLEGTVALVLVVVLNWTLHAVEKQLIHDPWEMIPPYQLF